jgi:Arc/MetJ-type ribon-helix-helix transcriptional regulator
MITKTKKPNMKRVSVFLPQDLIDYAKSQKSQTLSDLIRYGMKLAKQEKELQTKIRTQKFAQMSGKGGKIGDSEAWKKLNDIYEL